MPREFNASRGLANEEGSFVTSKKSNANKSKAAVFDMMAGFLLTLSNPKAILFYAALFPAFVDITQITIANTLGIMACATLAFGLVNLGYAMLAGSLAKRIKTTQAYNQLQKIAGMIMAAIGITVALKTQ